MVAAVIVAVISLVVSHFLVRDLEVKYEPKYNESSLIGTWIRSNSYTTKEEVGNYFNQRDVVANDTLIFSDNNSVVYKKETTYNYSHDKEKKWGYYELVSGSYSMKNDTLTIALDYPNIQREHFGEDPHNILGLGPIFVQDKDSIKDVYSVDEILPGMMKLILFKRISDTFIQNMDNVQIEYYRIP